MMKPVRKIDKIYQKVLDWFNASKKKVSREYIIAKIHADWCEDSRLIKPKFSSLQNRFNHDGVLFINLDYTNQTTTHQADLLVNALQIENVIRKNTETGCILLLSATQKTLLAKLYRDMRYSEMARAIKQHLN